MLDMAVLFENLSELASKELQEQLWLYGNEGQMSSFTESICGVFDDAKLTRALETGYIEKNFSSNLCKKVKQLDQAINLVPEDLPPAEIIKHPKMKVVRAISRELLDLFESEAVISRSE